MSMPETAITNSKRLVRGLMWERVRWLLRAHYCSHHQRFRLLTLAGPVPSEEVRCIRALMPNAHVTAVDKDKACVLAAMAADVDEVHHLDLTDYRKQPYGKSIMPAPLRGAQFDAISLDLTGTITLGLKDLVEVYWGAAQLLQPKGLLQVTFSYGRDVIEAFAERWERDRHSRGAEQKRLSKCPEVVQQRLWFLLLSKVQHIDCVLQYRSHAMPMVAFLMAKGRSVPSWQNPLPIPFRAVDEIDYELMLERGKMSTSLACSHARPRSSIIFARARRGRRRSPARQCRPGSCARSRSPICG